MCVKTLLFLFSPPFSFWTPIVQPVILHAPLFSFFESTYDLQFIGYVDVAYVNDLRNRRFIIGYAFLLCGGVVSYRCKT